MNGLEQIQHHLGGQFIDDEMRKADDFLGRVGWMMSWTKKRREIWYECCGKTLVDGEDNTADEEYALSNAMHRKSGCCPYCSAHIHYINRRFVRQNDYTQVYTVHYRMSQAEPNTLLVLGMWSGRRWYHVKLGTAPQDIRTEHEPCSMVILPWNGKPERFVREVLKGPGSYDSWWWGTRAAQDSGGWVLRDHVEGGDKQSITGSGIEYLVCDDLQEITRGTRWEKPAEYAKGAYGVWHSKDRVRPLKMFCTHPAMEYMLGNGMEGLLRGCANEDGTMGLIRWKRKNPREMLGLDGNELARLRRMEPGQVNGAGLLAHRLARKYGQQTKLEDVMNLTAQMGGVRYSNQKQLKSALERYGQRWGVTRILRYLAREKEHIAIWLDYMEELIQLGEAGDEARVFPRDLRGAHAETSARVRYKEDAVTGEKVIQRAEKLKNLSFEACGMILSPFETAEEIIREGSSQHICIGSYVKSYADGRTTLMKLRRMDAKDVPFHAVEMSSDGKHVVQCRGAYNETYPEDEAAVRAFWAAYDAARNVHNQIHLNISRREKTA